MVNRAYDSVRSMVEEHGGKMRFQRKGQPHGGAWVVSYKEWEKAFPTSGRLFPGIDNLYISKVELPQTWDDYTNELKKDAWKATFLINLL